MSKVEIVGEDFFPVGHVAIKTHLSISSDDCDVLDLDSLEAIPPEVAEVLDNLVDERDAKSANGD